MTLLSGHSGRSVCAMLEKALLPADGTEHGCLMPGGRRVRAGRVVVAVPLTALQSGDLAFAPPLPARKQVGTSLLLSDGR